MGPEFPSDMAMKLAHVWLRARRAAQVHTQQLATAVAAERQSSIGQPAKRAVVPAEPPSTSVPGKVRRLLPTGLPVEGPVMVTLAAEADPWAREDALKASKLDQLFRMVLEDVVDLTELVCLGPSWRIPAACRVSRRRWWQQPRGCRELVLEHWSRPSAVGASFARRRPMTSGGLHLSSWASSWGWWPLVGRRRRHRCMPASSGLRWPSGQPSTWTTSWPGPFVSTPCPTRGPRHQSWNLGSWSTSAWWWVRLGGPTRSCWPSLSWRQWAAFVLSTCSAPSSRPSTTPGWSSIAVRARAGSVVHGRHTPGACRMSPCKVRVSCASSMIFIAMKCPRQAFYFLRYASMQKTSGKSRNPRLLSPTAKCPVLGIWRSCAVPFSWRGQKRRKPKPRPSTAFAGASQRWQIRWNLVPLNSKLWATGPKSPRGGQGPTIAQRASCGADGNALCGGQSPPVGPGQAAMYWQAAGFVQLQATRAGPECWWLPLPWLLDMAGSCSATPAVPWQDIPCPPGSGWIAGARCWGGWPPCPGRPVCVTEFSLGNGVLFVGIRWERRRCRFGRCFARPHCSWWGDLAASGPEVAFGPGAYRRGQAGAVVSWHRFRPGPSGSWCGLYDGKRCLARIPRGLFVALADHSNWLYWETRAAYKTRCGWCGVPHVVRITLCPGRGPVIPRGDHSTVFQGFVLCWSFFSCLFWGMSWGARPWLSRTMSLTGVWQFWAHRPPGRFRHG